MEVVNNKEAKKPEKMTYEQLENVANQLSQQNERMYQQLQQMNLTNTFKRLDYLFKVVELQDAFNADFVVTCVKEIENMVTIPEEENKEEE